VKAAAIKAKELCASKGTDLARIAIKHWLKWVASQLHGLTLVVSIISGRYVGHCCALALPPATDAPGWALQDAWRECVPDGYGDTSRGDNQSIAPVQLPHNMLVTCRAGHLSHLHQW
jgi:hypothetical protein